MAPNVFDQRDPAHQDWLLRELVPAQLDGLFESQDIADLMDRQPTSSLGSVVAGYRRRRRELAPQEFLRQLWEAKARRGIAGPWDYQELAVRLREAG